MMSHGRMKQEEKTLMILSLRDGKTSNSILYCHSLDNDLSTVFPFLHFVWQHFDVWPRFFAFISNLL